MRLSRSPSVFGEAEAAVTSVMRSPGWLSNGHESVNQRSSDDLLSARRPVDHNAIDPLAFAKAEMQATIILAGESHSAINDTSLTQISRFDRHLSANCAAIAMRGHEVECDPVVRAVRLIAIHN